MLSCLRGAVMLDRLSDARVRAAAIFCVFALYASSARAADQVYFSANTNVTNILVNYINQENVRLDISSWYLSENAIFIAIINRYRAGVTVRIIGDRGAIFEADPNTKAQFYLLANEGIPIRLRFNPTWFPEIDHWKAAIFVGQNVVEFGSGNFAPTELAPFSSTNYDDESEMFTDDPAIVNAFKTKFDQMWNDTTTEPESIIGGPPYLKDWNDACANDPTGNCADYATRYPSPKPMIVDRSRLEPDYPTPPDLIWGQGPDFNNRLVAEINNESREIDIVVYRLETDDITQALLNKFNAGVTVKVIVDPEQYTNIAYPEYWLTHANVDRLWAAGVPILQRNHAGVTHMKTLITSNYATNASSNFGPNWQRDHDYFVSRATKTAIYNAFVNQFNWMWGNTSDFVPLVTTRPNAAALATPASGDTVSTSTPLVWNRAAWAVSYDVYLGTSPSSMTFVANVPAQMVVNPPNTYSYTPSLSAGTTYYWKVVSKTNATAKNSAMTNESATQSFTTSGSGGGGGGGGGGGTLSPFSGTPVAVPGTVNAEKFDNGGEGVAYHDTTAGNSGGQFRTTDVDIENSNEGGFDVGWTAPGEWLNYTVNVAAAGSYTVQVRVASPGGASFHLGFNISSKVWTTVSVPATGGWQGWTTVYVPVTLGAGTQQMTILFDTGGMNLGNVTISSGSGGGGGGLSPFSATPVVLPGTVSAEKFDNGGEGVAYHDTTAGNSGGAFRTTDVDIEAASEGGFDVGWVDAGEWLNYTVNVSAAGNYTAQLRVASPSGGATLHIGFNGPSAGQWKAVAIPATGGWQTWTTISVPVTLGAGVQQMTIYFDTAGVNLHHVQVQ
jgi:phosphatidylserine/phosphatidylglycerophosphate/cardiolipin synthase-like enzyme